MDHLFLLIAGVVTLGLYFVIAPMVTDTYRRYRKRKTVICPDTDQIAEVILLKNPPFILREPQDERRSRRNHWRFFRSC